MKKELSTLEIRQLVDEFEFLINGRIEKIYQTSKKEFVFKIHVTGGSRFLRINDKFIYLSPEKGETPEKPTTFCTILRKYLENKKIRKIAQKDSERIVVFETELHILVFELFGQTNIVLCDKDYEIISINRASNELKKGKEYKFPEERTSIFKIKENEFAGIIKKSKSEIVRTMAALIGGVYAEEVCLRAGTDKNLKEIGENDAKNIYKALVSLVKESPSPIVVYEETGPSDAVIYDLKLYENKNKVAFSNFYEAIESYLSQTFEVKKESEAEKKYQNQIEKAEKIMELQNKTIEKLAKEREQNQRAGELIYEKYKEVEKILNDSKAGKDNKRIISVDKKDKKITIEL